MRWRSASRVNPGGVINQLIGQKWLVARRPKTRINLKCGSDTKSYFRAAFGLRPSCTRLWCRVRGVPRKKCFHQLPATPSTAITPWFYSVQNFIPVFNSWNQKIVWKVSVYKVTSNGFVRRNCWKTSNVQLLETDEHDSLKLLFPK